MTVTFFKSKFLNKIADFAEKPNPPTFLATRLCN
jgi:hypothetical protein